MRIESLSRVGHAGHRRQGCGTGNSCGAGAETDPHRRGYIARSLGNAGDTKSLPALYKAIKKETDAGARGEMRGAIGKLGGKPRNSSFPFASLRTTQRPA